MNKGSNVERKNKCKIQTISLLFPTLTRPFLVKVERQGE